MATHAVATLSFSTANRLAIGQAGGIELLIALASETADNDLRETAVEALSFLTNDKRVAVAKHLVSTAGADEKKRVQRVSELGALVRGTYML